MTAEKNRKVLKRFIAALPLDAAQKELCMTGVERLDENNVMHMVTIAEGLPAKIARALDAAKQLKDAAAQAKKTFEVKPSVNPVNLMAPKTKKSIYRRRRIIGELIKVDDGAIIYKIPAVTRSEKTSPHAGNHLNHRLRRRVASVPLRDSLELAVCYMELVPNLETARDFVTRGRVVINGVRITNPSYKLKSGDVIKVLSDASDGTYAGVTGGADRSHRGMHLGKRPRRGR